MDGDRRIRFELKRAHFNRHTSSGCLSLATSEDELAEELFPQAMVR